jgi:hypothetical protein
VAVLTTRETRSKKGWLILIQMKIVCFQDSEDSFLGITSTCQMKFSDFCNSTNTPVAPTSKITTPIIDPQMVDFD